MSSRRVLTAKVPNVNVTKHNPERRAADANFSFFKSWGYGMEGMSKYVNLPIMHPVYGNRGEIFLVSVLGVGLYMMVWPRRKQEERLNNMIVATNTWAEVPGAHRDLKL